MIMIAKNYIAIIIREIPIRTIIKITAMSAIKL